MSVGDISVGIVKDCADGMEASLGQANKESGADTVLKVSLDIQKYANTENMAISASSKDLEGVSQALGVLRK